MRSVPTSGCALSIDRGPYRVGGPASGDTENSPPGVLTDGGGLRFRRHDPFSAGCILAAFRQRNLMWLVYAVALVVGGGIVLLQVLAGADHHIGTADASLDAHHAPTGPGLLSTRSITFAVFAFGLVGTPIQAFGLASPTVVLAVAVASGVAAGLVAGLAFRALGHGGASGEAA